MAHVSYTYMSDIDIAKTDYTKTTGAISTEHSTWQEHMTADRQLSAALLTYMFV